MSRWSPPPPPPTPNRLSPSDASLARHAEVKRRLALDPRTFWRFPIPSLHKIVGSLAPEELMIVGALPQNGKSLMAHNIAQWRMEQAKPTFIFGTEQSSHVLAIKQACVALAINARDVLKPEDADVESGHHAALVQQVEDYCERAIAWSEGVIQWSNHETINATALVEGVQWAVEEMGPDVCIILDHIHHMDHGPGVNAPQELKRTIHLGKQLCKQHGITMIVMAQLKRREGLTALEPPAMDDLGGSAALEQTADIILGQWRPLRRDLDREQIKALRENIRAQKAFASELYEPDAMAVALLKDRLGVAPPGRAAILKVERGRLVEYPERDRYSTAFGARDGV